MGVSLVIGGLLAGIVAILLMLQSNLVRQNQTPISWLIWGGLVVVAFGFAVLSRNELTRVRFTVFEDGFTPPFATFAQLLRREDLFVPYRAIARVDSQRYVRSGETRIDEVSIELTDGRRVVVRDADVGHEGLQTLLQASEEYWRQAPRGEVPSPTAVHGGGGSRIPAWIRGEMRMELVVIGIALVGILLFFSAFFLLPGVIETGWRILVPLVLLTVLVPVLLFMAYRVWRRARELTEERRRELPKN